MSLHIMKRDTLKRKQRKQRKQRKVSKAKCQNIITHMYSLQMLENENNMRGKNVAVNEIIYEREKPIITVNLKALERVLIELH